MANVTVNVQVTPSTTTPTTYTWAYNADGGTTFTTVTCTSNFASVMTGTSDTITMNLVANGQPGDTCVFQSAPLSFFTDYELQEPFTPEWYTAPSGGTSSIQFTDGNPNQFNRTYYFRLNAVYTPSGQNNGGNIQSPDPTIVNVGTDGTREFEFGRKSDHGALREPAAVAV